MTAAVRDVVTVPAGDLTVGDRFRDGWVVKATRTKDGKTTVVLGKSGYRGKHPRLFDADRPLSVERKRKVSTAGAYVRSQRRSRETGTTIQVLDLTHRDSEFEPEGARWATVCVEHATITTHRTLSLAEAHSKSPTGWCGTCPEAHL